MAATNNGDFTKAFYVAIVVALVGLVMNLIYTRMKKRAQASSQSEKSVV